MSTLERHRAKRGGNRSVVTKLIQEAETLLEGEFDDKTKARLKTIQTTLKEKKTILDVLNESILNECEVTEIKGEIEESEDYDQRLRQTEENIATKLRSTRKKQETQETPTDQQPTIPLPRFTHGTLTESPPPRFSSPSAIGITPNRSTDSAVSTSSATHAKLPKLILPKFKGDILHFKTFWDSFESSVHNNTGLNNIDKLNYLKSLLEGPALRAIDGLPITDDNYRNAIDILTQRFGQPQQLISAHMDELLKIPPCSSDKPSHLRYVYDKIHVNIRGLDSLGISAQQYGSMLIPIIMSKLTPQVRIQVARSTVNDVWEINDLLNVIRKEIEAREISEKVQTTTDQRPRPQAFNATPNVRSTSSSRPLQTTSSFVTNIDNSNSAVNDKTPVCVFCNERHYSASCAKIEDKNERKSLLRNQGRCFVCLRKGHKSPDCLSKKTCRICKGKHHQSICQPKDEVTQNTDPHGEQESISTTQLSNVSSLANDENQATTTVTGLCKGTVLLQTARAVASNGTQNMNVRVLFDTGSQRSYITKAVMERLKLQPIRRETIHLNTFGSSEFKRQSCEVFQLKLFNKDVNNSEGVELSAIKFPVICTPLQSPINVNYPHLQGLHLADNDVNVETSPTIDVLIGADHYWDFVTGEVAKGDDGPVATKSKLGWLLSGKTGPHGNANLVTSNLIISGENIDDQSANDELINSLKRFFETESIGINDQPQQPEESFMKDITHNGERYEVRLPWKGNSFLNLETDRELCVKRLMSLHNKLSKDPELLQQYDKGIKEQLASGIIEPVQDTVNKQENVHYLPHHGVVRKDRETTKLRIVYDGSATTPSRNQSLNDCLLTGPNYIPHLFDILIKFRMNPVALVADIEKAFLMIGIADQDRDMLRFLWFKDINNPNLEVVEYKFCRLVFGLRPSPAILGATIDHHLQSYKEQSPETVNTLKDSLYVDDFISGAENEDKAFNIYKEAKQIMSAGAFNLRKWNSNSSALIADINKEEAKLQSHATSSSSKDTTTDEDLSFAKSTIGPQPDSSKDKNVKVLGVMWDTASDVFKFTFTELIQYVNSLPVTKRSVLKVTAKVFDPVGFLTPFTIQMKVLFQELCTQKAAWDDELQGEQRKKWDSFVQQLNTLNEISIPRCYFDAGSKPSSIEIHGFSDASARAFAATVYVRAVYEDHVSVHLLASKTKVAPIKKQSIPRLELLGATILARLVNKVSKTLSETVDRIVLWTDSMTTLCWIRNERPWKQYVHHRVQEIRQLTDRESWRFCPGSDNPADLPSRGLSAKDLANSAVWWKGPEFLYHPETEWPKNQAQNNNTTAMEEAVKSPTAITHSLTTSTKETLNLNQVIACDDFSSLQRLLRVTAYVIRFVNNLKRRHETHKESITSKELEAHEISNAETLWIRTIQSSSFPEEIESLSEPEKKTKPMYVKQFGLFINEEGIIKAKGRLENSSLTESSKNPILLPASHKFTELVVKDCHNQIHHSGLNGTLAATRERFWIIKGRQTVKQILKACVTCRKMEGMPYQSPNIPDLPKERVSEDPPFTNTGIDFAGPLYVKKENAADKEDDELEKAYVCLFTCASTRAVHLELVRTLTVESFLLAFRRFTSRRGLPAVVMSDNAKTFKSACKEIQRIARSTEIRRFMANQQIKWTFIVEKAPWWGGFWERMVQTVKRSLRKSIGRSTLTYDNLNTLLIEVETIINNRPLTYMNDDQLGITYTLSPSHLIYGRRISNSPNTAHADVQSTYQTLYRKSKTQRFLLNQFIKCWRRDYLLSLREAHTSSATIKNRPIINPGDVVILKNESTKRAFWKLAIVTELLEGNDGQVRAATVKVGTSNESKPRVLRRSVRNLFPIEVNSDADQQQVPLQQQSTPERTGVLQSRPRRQAAIDGEMMRRLHNN